VLAPLFRAEVPDPLAAMLYADAKLGLVDDMLHYFDRMSMAHSLEVRVPFLDHHLVEFASRIPSRFKVRGLTTKWILKQAARGLVPDQIIDKPKIGFFNASVEHWMERALHGSVRETLTAADCRFGDYLDAQSIRRLASVPAAQRSRADRHLLLAVTMLEHWLAQVFAAPARLRPFDSAARTSVHLTRS
jgi:asparagine synthase (glutamine-hydrolysing)